MVKIFSLALLLWALGICNVVAEDMSKPTETVGIAAPIAAVAPDASATEISTAGTEIQVQSAETQVASDVAAVSSTEQPATDESVANAPAQGTAPQPEPQPVMEIDMSQSGNVTLDFRDADIKNVLKVLSYKSGVNIIAGPEVVGLVNIQLRDVPWMKAMEVILSTYGYGFEQKGSIIMVTTIDNLKKRREDAKVLADQEPLSNETFTLSFGKAEDVLKSLEKMKTPRGSINFDARTNSIIVSDIDSNIVLLRDVVKKLDSVTPQVLIEAKIIETTLNKSENLGIDWTLQASAGGAKRVATFPFSAKGSGNEYMPAAVATSTTAGEDTLGPTITYGTLDFSAMSAVLKMLKTRADTNILSNPRIVTLDNQPAKISVGSQYPIPQYTYNDQQAKLQVSGWSYLDIGIIFNVTPHVNNAGLVTLDVEPTVTDILSYVTVENTQMPQLSSEQAKTKVMIKDGETLIIAGLIKDRKSDTRKKVPILGDIPILGLPFQKKETSAIKTELLIFITPHIITPDVGQKAVAGK